MKYLTKLLKSSLFVIVSFLVLTFIFTTLNYFNIINGKTMEILKIIIPLLTLALGGYIMGKGSEKNGWLEGLKLGLIIVFLILIGNLIFSPNLIMKDFIFYILLLMGSMLGGMFGINRK
ncbi:MAG: TIGR04086 family membrane protein [Bacilli bacterium]|nr:TIGR04086 family membrane protein [Bacilli bacterium]